MWEPKSFSSPGSSPQYLLYLAGVFHVEHRLPSWGARVEARRRQLPSIAHVFVSRGTVPPQNSRLLMRANLLGPRSSKLNRRRGSESMFHVEHRRASWCAKRHLGGPVSPPCPTHRDSSFDVKDQQGRSRMYLRSDLLKRDHPALSPAWLANDQGRSIQQTEFPRVPCTMVRR